MHGSRVKYVVHKKAEHVSGVIFKLVRVCLFINKSSLNLNFIF